MKKTSSNARGLIDAVESLIDHGLTGEQVFKT